MMHANHLYNPLPYLTLKVCCDDTGVHAQHYEKPKGIRRGTIPISEGLGLPMKTALSGVSRTLRAATAAVSDITRYSIRQLSRLTCYTTLKGVDYGYQA